MCRRRRCAPRPSGPGKMFATGPPALEALAPYAPTPLRLARPLARTTRTRNETETDFPIELIPSISHVTGSRFRGPPLPTHRGGVSRSRVKPHAEVSLLLLLLGLRLLHTRSAAAGCCWLGLPLPGLLLLTDVASDATLGCLMKAYEN